MPILRSVASTFDFNVTRDQLIQAALETARVCAEGETMTPEQLNIGIVRLNMIVREVDQSGNFVWTTQEAKHLPLQSGVGVYDANAGLPTNISELLSVVYRSADGSDSKPLKILKAEGYEAIPHKHEAGEPRAVHLSTDIYLEQRRLYVWPFPSTVTAESVIVGSDNQIYRCIYPHTSTATNKPVTGANWRMVWQAGGASVTAWALGENYRSAESLRMVIKRPIFDFDEADDTPDLLMQCPRLLMYRLASDLADVWGMPQDVKDTINGKMRGAFTDIFPSTRPKSNDVHHKALYF